MHVNTSVFPSIQFNLFADPIDFVGSWINYFPYDENKVNRYLQLIDNTSYTNDELLWLFEYHNGGSLKGERFALYCEQIESRVNLFNVLKEAGDFGDLYNHPFMSIDTRWFIFLHHILYRLPYFDDNIYYAYHFITEGSLPYEQTDDDFCVAHGNFVSFIEEMMEETPAYDEVHWIKALSAFGMFLREFGWVMF